MDKFRENRRLSSQKKQPAQKLQNLSPMKYGKAAYNQMCFTPNKICENPLYRESGNMKKNEEITQRLREIEAAYSLLEDKFEKITKQKAGMEESLTLQVNMYKKLMEEMERKAQERLKDIQVSFKKQIQNIIADKQEQAKFAQSEKQQLEEQIRQLEQIGNQLQVKLHNVSGQLKEITNNLNKKFQQAHNLQENYKFQKQQHQASKQKYQTTVDNLKERVIETERQGREKMDKAVEEKNKQIKDIHKQHKQQINKVHQQREAQRGQKQDQLKQFQKKFDEQRQHLNQIIQTKNKGIQELNKQASDSQEKLSNMARGYEQEIISLSNEKSRLFEEVDKLNDQNTNLNVLLKDQQFAANKEKTNLENFIIKLKEDISYSQGNFLKERDRNVMNQQDCSKEIIITKRQNSALKAQLQNYIHKKGDNERLVNQIKKLRDMLMESSFEMQKCKDEFIKLGKERDLLAIRLEQSTYQNGSLKRMKYDRQEEAKSWRDSYYLTRSRSRRR